MRMVRLLPLLCACIAVSGCFGGGNRYARYQNQGAAIRQVDRLLAQIPQIAGARMTKRSESSSSYKVGTNRYINAEPYSSTLAYTGPPGVTGERILSHFRHTLPSRGWTCQFRHHAEGTAFSFGCARGPASIDGLIGTHSQYVLIISASSVQPKIHVVPGD
jgi:hypothetical protein